MWRGRNWDTKYQIREREPETGVRMKRGRAKKVQAHVSEGHPTLANFPDGKSYFLPWTV